MDLNLSDLLTIDIPITEIFVRGTCMYLGVFILLRVILKREVGSVGIPDLLMITFIADAAQNGMTGDYHSISAGLLLVFTLVFWNFVLDLLSANVAWFERLVRAKPLCLVSHGKLLLMNLHAASMSRGELMALLRKEGIEHLSAEKAVYLEGDGEISVIKKKTNS